MLNPPDGLRDPGCWGPRRGVTGLEGRGAGAGAAGALRGARVIRMPPRSPGASRVARAGCLGSETPRRGEARRVTRCLSPAWLAPRAAAGATRPACDPQQFPALRGVRSCVPHPALCSEMITSDLTKASDTGTLARFVLLSHCELAPGPRVCQSGPDHTGQGDQV